mgnify:FL=1
MKDEDVKGNVDIVFVNSVFNIGESYSTSTGRFTASKHGVYMFSVYLCTYNNRLLYYALVKDGVVLLQGSQRESNNVMCTSATVTTTLKVGEAVWVKGTSAGSTSEIMQDSLRRNTFSGALIQKLNIQ